ncbi:MAG: amidohydrolase family protein, partial [Treponema sp.]|nr:amidohydrolase family protein [Treponema sp.]
MQVILNNFHIIDEETDMTGMVIIEDGFISKVLSAKPPDSGATMVIDGSSFSVCKKPVLMPAFVDLHAHLRDPGIPEKEEGLFPEAPFPSEVFESACLAAVAGGFGTVVCMANTIPAIDSQKKVLALKKRSDALGLIDLYPVMSLTRGMEGKELSEITTLVSRTENDNSFYVPIMLSEDGKDIANDDLFLAAMKEAKRLNLAISCHCDFGGNEQNAVRRVIELGKKANCHIHIAHVSTKEAVTEIARVKTESQSKKSGSFKLSCEAMPHNICLTEEDAKKLGDSSWGRVNPPLRTEKDRQAIVRALADGTIDAIATD